MSHVRIYQQYSRKLDMLATHNERSAAQETNVAVRAHLDAHATLLAKIEAELARNREELRRGPKLNRKP